jgi:hypothetical protein
MNLAVSNERARSPRREVAASLDRRWIEVESLPDAKARVEARLGHQAAVL